MHKNKKGAEAFINFMMEPEVALQNQEFIYYASANDKVKIIPIRRFTEMKQFIPRGSLKANRLKISLKTFSSLKTHFGPRLKATSSAPRIRARKNKFISSRRQSAALL